jgi:hypothetical protein
VPEKLLSMPKMRALRPPLAALTSSGAPNAAARADNGLVMVRTPSDQARLPNTQLSSGAVVRCICVVKLALWLGARVSEAGVTVTS